MTFQPAPAPEPDLLGTVAWTTDDTEAYLTANPLPADFNWPHRDYPPEKLQPVHPQNRVHKGYGFWLRHTPYFPGLFERIHRIIVAAGAKLPDVDQIAAELRRSPPTAPSTPATLLPQ